MSRKYFVEAEPMELELPPPLPVPTADPSLRGVESIKISAIRPNPSQPRVTFEPASIGYDLKQLKDLAADTTADRYVEAGTTKDGKPQYTVRYTARELTDKLPTGVTAVKASLDFTVTVVDNGGGTLAATANYPKGGLAFTNTYSWQPVVVDPDAIKDAAVTKILKGDRGTGLADGEFEFRPPARSTP